MERTDIGCPVSEERDHHSRGSVHLRSPSQAIRNGHRRADDPSGDHHAHLGIGQMHRSALALAGAVHPACDFSPQGAQRHVLGDHILNAAIDRADLVLVIEQVADGGRDHFLPPRRIIRHGQSATTDRLADRIVIAFDAQHAAIDIDERVRARFWGVALICHDNLLMSWTRITLVGRWQWQVNAPWRYVAGLRDMRGPWRVCTARVHYQSHRRDIQ